MTTTDRSRLDAARAHPRRRARWLACLVPLAALGAAAVVTATDDGADRLSTTAAGPAPTTAPAAMQELPLSERPATAQAVPVDERSGPAAWKAGAEVPVDAWVRWHLGQAAVRPAVSGRVREGEAGREAATGRPPFTFRVGADDGFRIDVGTAVHYADATTDVGYSAGRGTLSGMVGEGVGRPGGDLRLPNDVVDRLLNPGRWIEVMAANVGVHVTYEGPGETLGRPSDRYHVTFDPLPAKYDPEGWHFEVDRETGVLLQYAIHFSEATGIGVERMGVADLAVAGAAVAPAPLVVPEGTKVDVLVKVPDAEVPLEVVVERKTDVATLADGLVAEARGAR